jgi:acyl dehydratase
VPIDIERVVGAELLELRTSWTPDDVILYHLGLGAGTSPIDAGELSYLYEGGLKVLPSYGVVPVLPALTDMLALRGMDVDLATLLHGEQDLEIHAELPAAAEVSTAARVTDVFDKGRAALVVLETVTTTTDTRPRRLFTNRFRAFIRGEGGFGGDTGPSETLDPPAREPDHVTEHSTLPQQALLYRLSGDKNPIHADPAFARRGGFDRPILHGLCSYGIACKAVVDAVLDGKVGRVARFRARFAGVVFPGETIVVSMWDQGDHVVVAADTAERATPVLRNAAIELRGAAA